MSLGCAIFKRDDISGQDDLQPGPSKSGNYHNIHNIVSNVPIEDDKIVAEILTS